MLAHSNCHTLPPPAAHSQHPLVHSVKPHHLPRPVHRITPPVSWSQFIQLPGLAEGGRDCRHVQARVFQQDADIVPETNDEWDDEDDRV